MVCYSRFYIWTTSKKHFYPRVFSSNRRYNTIYTWEFVLKILSPKDDALWTIALNKSIGKLVNKIRVVIKEVNSFSFGCFSCKTLETSPVRWGHQTSPNGWFHFVVSKSATSPKYKWNYGWNSPPQCIISYLLFHRLSSYLILRLIKCW